MKSLITGSALLVITIVLLVCPCHAQVVQDGNKTGYPFFGTFHGSDIDNVSLTNGNLHVEIPLHRVAQRGKKQYSVIYVYDTPGWMILYYPPVQRGQLGQWAVNPMNNTDQSQGWRYVSSIDGGYLNYEQVNQQCPGNPPQNTIVYQNYNWTDSMGTRHQLPLRKQSPINCNGQTF